MIEASRAGIRFRAKDLPVLPGALALAEKGHWSGGVKRNRRYIESTLGARGQLAIDRSLPEPLVNLLFESETSGASSSPFRRRAPKKCVRASGHEGDMLGGR